MEFKIGDRVVCLGEVNGGYSTRGECGVVINISDLPLIQFDNPIAGAHNGNGLGKYGHCLWVFTDRLKLETAMTPIIPAAEREYITL